MLKKRFSLLTIVLACTLSLSGCALLSGLAALSDTPRKRESERRLSREKENNPMEFQSMYEEGTLLAMVESEEQAEEIAELYGITLVRIDDSLAKFSTDKDLNELIELGRKNGWPPLQPNYIYQAF